MKQARPLSFTVLVTLFLSLLAFLLGPHFAFAQEDDSEQPEKALQEIQSQIKNRQSQLHARLNEAKRLQQRLRKAELSISSLTQDIVVSDRRIEDNLSEQKQLVKEKALLLKRKNNQQNLLAKQMRSAYMSGNNDYTKMLLNQEDAGKFERMLVYYRYLNFARQDQIKQFEALVSELLDVAKKLKESNEKLQAEKEKQLQQKQTLLAQQKEREDTLAALNNVIDNEAAQIEQLQINEQNLVQALEDARNELERNAQELTGIEPFRGKLLKPADGRLRKLFGKRRQGQVRWKGVLFYGDSGNPIRAIHHGKVLFSDWLRGFGLMTILDHGDGYMSLYGHNQALLKQVGDYVEAGETIALLGQSGGQNQPSLYFEIRHKGQPVNPSKWLQK
ncbi:peptidoglycan DD-metalloendopeptidase family protein [Alteromonas sp. a30]|nr:peptidoglycan DD-metalloendopeptidase family protein [Alteromonas sp. a30]